MQSVRQGKKETTEWERYFDNNDNDNYNDDDDECDNDNGDGNNNDNRQIDVGK